MILGQLIQMGRRFCECRSQDFIPESDDVAVVLAYSMSDSFIAHSFDIAEPDAGEKIRAWLETNRAIAYILVTRHFDDLQEELPAPIGRPHQERLSIVAATSDNHSYATFVIDRRPRANAVKLERAQPADDLPPVAAANLFLAWYEDEEAAPEAAVAQAFRYDRSSLIGAN